jgi:iron complex outermembrane receptor protein
MTFAKNPIPVTALPILCIFLFVLTAPAEAGNLIGTVTDGGDGMSLAGATVKVTSSDPSVKAIVTAADRNGHYEIRDIPPGQYTVTISTIGFTMETIADVVIAESGDKTLDVVLTPSAVNLGAVSVTASRRPEKILSAPAAVNVLEAEKVEARTTLTPTEHIKGLPAVDVASTGLNQSNVVVRGFNNIFSGALLVLTDNRLARVPSLRYNAYNFIPTTNEDIEQMEVVSGPGSALYGPNAASGVMHIVTKSPFNSPGTSISLGAGERDLYLGSIRHAGTYSDWFGYKITGQYYQGRDWETRDSSEPAYIQKFRPTPFGPVAEGDTIVNERDYDIEKLAGEARMDFLLSRDLTLKVNGGFNRASGIELTGLGAAQAVDWTYSFAQARLRYKDLYVQGFVNMSDAGDSYLLTTGQLIIDRSKLWAAQVQHRYDAGGKIPLTYGLDLLLTRPETEATINGRHEDNDNIDELGGYLQGDVVLSDNFKFVGAVRLDKHSQLEEPVFSPRAALVYEPDDKNNVRLTYNRAFSTPDNNNLFLDMLQAIDIGGMGDTLGPVLGFDPGINVRVQGVPESGFHWRVNEHGPQFRSTFAPLAGLGNDEFINYNDPSFTNAMYGAGRTMVMDTVGSQLNQLVSMGLLTQQEANEIENTLEYVTPSNISGNFNYLMTLDPDNQDFVRSYESDIADINRLEPTITQTYELGYKGVLADRLRFSVDVYRTEKKNFIGALSLETPNVFFDTEAIAAYLYQQVRDSLDANPAYDSVLALVDAYYGNNNGDPADDLAYLFSSWVDSIPVGTVTPQEAYDPTAILVTYRNFGDISFYGADLHLAYHINQNWNVSAMYSYISKNYFEKSEDQVHDIHLNAPRNKAGLSAQYLNPRWGLDVGARYRFVDAFDMDSPFFGSTVEAYHLVDFNAGVGFVYNTRLVLTVQNLFDNKHIEFVGGPEIGRLAILRLNMTF